MANLAVRFSSHAGFGYAWSMARQNGQHETGDDERTRRARADLQKLDEQSEKLLGAQGHEHADDSNDPAVIWGRRIGRSLGLIFAAYLCWYLFATYIQK